LNLGIGQPAPELLPTAALQAAAESTLSSVDPRYLLQYGSPAGCSSYLEAVASFLTEQLGHAHDPTTLFATPGNSGGLALVARTLTQPGDTVFVEDPTYFLAHQILRDYSLELLPLPHRVDGRGTLDVEQIRKRLSAMPDGPRPRLLYCVPTANNPTGVSMPDEDRAALVSLCAEHGVIIISDDVYEMLQWQMADAPSSLRWHADAQAVPGTVVSLGSWSKLLGPGLRLGWIDCGDANLLRRFAADGEVDSGSLTSPLVEALVTSMLTSGGAKAHLVSLRAALARRASLLADAINAEQPDGKRVVECSSGGYFLWVDLGGLDAGTLRDTCAATEGVSFLPGARCALDNSSAKTRARVSFAFLSEDDLTMAGRRLGRAIAHSHAS
jgi:2-aminoadipate transaminase